MIPSSNFGEQPHNVISPITCPLQAEEEDARVSVGACEVNPEDSLHEDSTKEDSDGKTTEEDSDGKTQVDSCDESQQFDNAAAATTTEKEPCVYCGQNPCDWVTFEADICEECEELEQEKCNDKEIRHHAYRLYTRLRYGVLRKFDRRPLPICVRGEIMDNWPDPNHSYVGFQDALRDVSEIG
jgi:hypothetical protein